MTQKTGSTGPKCATPLIRGFYLNKRTAWSKTNVVNAVQRLNRIEEWLADRDSSLADATTEQLDDYLYGRLDVVEANTVIVDRRQIRAFYKWAHAHQMTATNPATSLAVIKGTDADPARTPDVDEWQYRAVMATTIKRRTATGSKRCLDLRDAAIISLLWDTGLRRSELVKIEYRHIDWDEQTIYLPLTKARTRTKSRTIVIGPESFPHLLRYCSARPEDGGRGDRPGPLFESTHRSPGTEIRLALVPQSVSLMLNRRAAIANKTQRGLPGVVYVPSHGFRRTSTMNDIDSGMSERTIQILKGWDEADGRMLAKYSRRRRTEQALAEARRIKNGEPLLRIVGDR